MDYRNTLMLSAGTVLCLTLFQSNVAFAQATPGNNPPIRSSNDINGVDLTTGSFQVADPSLSLGTSASGISNTQFWTGNGWRNNFIMELVATSSGAAVNIGNKQYSFTLSSGLYVSDQGNQSTLSLDPTSNIYTFYDIDGVKYTFDPNDTALYSGVTGIPVKYLTKPSGERVSFTYGTARPPAGAISHLLSVNSSSGFQVKFSYSSYFNIPSNFTLINSGIDYCDPTANQCTSLSQNWPSATYAFSAQNNVTTSTTTDTLGRVTTYQETYLNPGSPSSTLVVTAIKRPGSSTYNVNIFYDTNGRVSSVQRDGQTWTYTWALSGTTLSATIVDPNANVTKTTADTTKKIITSYTNGLGNTTIYVPDSFGRITNVNLPDGNSYIDAYDNRGNVTSRTVRSKNPGTDPDIITAATYPVSCGNIITCNKPTSTTDPKGNTTYLTYDPVHGGLLTLTSPTVSGLSPQFRYSYTALQAYYKNNLGSIVASGVPTYEMTGVSTCRTSSSCNGTADEIRTSVGYGATGVANNLLPTQMTIGAGDGSLSSTTSTGYDATGNISASTDALGNVTRYRYDADRELVGVAGPAPGGALKNRALRLTYNADGLTTLTERGTVASQSDADWVNFSSLQQIAVSYDSADRKSQVSIQSGGTTYAVTQFSYDAAGRPLCQAHRMNPNVFGSLPTSACVLGTTGSYGPDEVTLNSYDQADEITQITNGYNVPSDQANDATYQYTKNGRLSSVVDAQGNKTSYVYDGFDRLFQTFYPSPTAGAGTSSTTDYEQLAHDANGNTVSRRLRSGQSISYTYDALNRMTVKTLPSPESAVSYGYDLLGRSTSVSQGSLNHAQSYDALGRLTSEAQPFGTMSYQYDLAGRRTATIWPDGFYVSYDHLATGEVSAIRENGAPSGIGVLASYGYDDLGRRTSLTRGNGTSTNYSYDNASRLNSLALDLSGTSNDVTFGFSYSPANQIVATTRSNDVYAWAGAADRNDGSSINGLNQATTVGAGSLSYDSKGNLSSTGTTTFSYTSENRLSAANTGVSLYYDALGRLSEYDTSVSTRFVYDGAQMVAEINNPSGAVTKRFVFGPGGDEPLVEYDASGSNYTRAWLHADERGSIIAQTDDSGVATALNSYDEYGVPGVGNAGRFQYTGQAWLPTLGLYYYKARMYSSRLGRFLQTDPIGYGNGANWYNYVGSDPVNASDPNGTTTYDDGGEAPIPPDIIVTGQLLQNNYGPSPSFNPFNLPSFERPNLRTLNLGAANGLRPKATTHEKRCSRLKAAANDLGNAYEKVALGLGAAAFGGAIGTALSVAGEEVTLGLDTPLTLTAATFTEETGHAALVTGAVGAALKSFAAGNFNDIGKFGAITTGAVVLEHLTSKIPFGKVITGLIERTAEIATEEKDEGC